MPRKPQSSGVGYRDSRGRWRPGRSGNASGRPAGLAGLAAMILAETHDGRELVHFALEIFRDERQPHAARCAMHGWLSDRGFGRPLATVELHAAVAAISTGPQVPTERVLARLPEAALRMWLAAHDAEVLALAPGPIEHDPLIAKPEVTDEKSG